MKRPIMRSVPCAINCRGDGNQVLALIGSNIQEGVCGFGDTLPDALRDLATQIEHEVDYESDLQKAMDSVSLDPLPSFLNQTPKN